MAMSERSEFDEQSAAIARSFHLMLLKYSPGIRMENTPLLKAVVKKLLIDGVIEPGESIKKQGENLSGS